MVSTALILLAGRYSARVVVPACIILGREIAVSALREWMASRGIRNVVQVGYQGKIKTATTMVCITLLLLVPNIVTEFWAKIRELSFLLLYLSTLITVTSAASYFRAAAPHFLNIETN
jgi:CDP-diacylglycerol---glycerol-3-phosphate 3-phosphatidyltransferase